MKYQYHQHFLHLSSFMKRISLSFISLTNSCLCPSWDINFMRDFYFNNLRGNLSTFYLRGGFEAGPLSRNVSPSERLLSLSVLFLLNPVCKYQWQNGSIVILVNSWTFVYMKQFTISWWDIRNWMINSIDINNKSRVWKFW